MGNYYNYTPLQNYKNIENFIFNKRNNANFKENVSFILIRAWERIEYHFYAKIFLWKCINIKALLLFLIIAHSFCFKFGV